MNLGQLSVALVRVYDIAYIFPCVITNSTTYIYYLRYTGDRSDKVRTYNFPQDRVTDHRVSVSVIGVSRVLSGESLDEFIDALYIADENERLQAFMESLVKQK